MPTRLMLWFHIEKSESAAGRESLPILSAQAAKGVILNRN